MIGRIGSISRRSPGKWVFWSPTIPRKQRFHLSISFLREADVPGESLRNIWRQEMDTIMKASHQILTATSSSAHFISNSEVYVFHLQNFILRNGFALGWRQNRKRVGDPCCVPLLSYKCFFLTNRNILLLLDHIPTEVDVFLLLGKYRSSCSVLVHGMLIYYRWIVLARYKGIFALIAQHCSWVKLYCFSDT